MGMGRIADGGGYPLGCEPIGPVSGYVHLKYLEGGEETYDPATISPGSVITGSECTEYADEDGLYIGGVRSASGTREQVSDGIGSTAETLNGWLFWSAESD